MGKELNVNSLLKLALLTSGKNNSSKKKTTSNKTGKTPFFNRGLRRFFFDPEKGFFIIIPGKNGKAKKQYLPGLFAFKNVGYRIIPWKPTR